LSFLGNCTNIYFHSEYIYKETPGMNRRRRRNILSMRACPISIIYPCSAKDALLNVVDSLTTLPAENYELIVVHSYSADGVDALCRQEGLTFVSLPDAKGRGAAFNTGARLSTGDQLLFCDRLVNPADMLRPTESQPTSYHEDGKAVALKLSRESVRQSGGFSEKNVSLEELFSEYRQRVAMNGYEWKQVEWRTARGRRR